MNGDGDCYIVVVNDEEQHSVWSAGRELPVGWRDAGVSGTKQRCLEHIGRVWPDVRPKSLRDRVARGHRTEE